MKENTPKDQSNELEIVKGRKLNKKQIALSFHKLNNLIEKTNLDEKEKKGIIKLINEIKNSLEIKPLSKTTLEELKELGII